MGFHGLFLGTAKDGAALIAIGRPVAGTGVEASPEGRIILVEPCNSLSQTGALSQMLAIGTISTGDA